MTGSSQECDDFDACFTKNLMINALAPAKIGRLFNAMNMNGTNIQETKVGVDLQNTRMARFRREGEDEIIAMKTDLENGMLNEVIQSEETPVFSTDGFYTDRNNKAQAHLGSLYAEHGGRSVCVGSVLLKRKGRLSTELAKSAPGIIVDLPATQLESYALELQMKRVAKKTKRQFYLCAVQGSLDLYFIFDII